ncbi:MAG: thioredoxin family protein [Actinobacteria bacterium]|nr:thioredoxin family protein [Actinomycetota bacterium]
MVDRLEREYEGKVRFERINADTHESARALMAQFGVTAFPSFVFVGSDGSVKGRLVGAVPEEQLREQLDALR